ncbi:PAS domain S-box protein [bacterium]|nr:PAS domain S-box protein [bacterium]
MKSADITREKLLQEVELLKAKITQLEKSEIKHKKPADSLQKSELQYRIIMEASLQGMSKVDAKGFIRFANMAVAKLSGYSLTELDGMSLDTLYPPGEAKVISDANVVLLLSGKPIVGENTMTRKDGSGIETHFSCVPVFDENDEYDGFISSILDITERKQSEKKLLESEIRLSNIIGQAKDSIVEVAFTPEGDPFVKDCNEAMGRMHGYTREEMIGKLIFEIDAKLTRDELRVLGRHSMIEKPTLIESVHIRKDDSRFPIEVSFQNIQIPGYDPIMIAIERDITERKQAERRIDHLNLVLQAIRNVNQLIVKEKDRDRLVKGACENLIETRGYYYAWIALLDESGEFITAAAAGLDQDFLSIIKILKSGKTIECVNKALKKSGVIIIENPASECKDCPLAKKYMEMGRMVIRLEYDAKIYGLMTVSIPIELISDIEEHKLLKEVAEDIAFALHGMEVEKEHKQAEEALRKSEEVLRDFLDNANDLIQIVAPDNRYIYVNHKWLEVLGYTADEVVNLSMSDIIHPDSIAHCMNMFQRLLAGEAVDMIDAVFIARDGAEIQVEGSVSCRFENGEPVNTRGVFRNITDRKRAEEALQESENNLRALFNAMTDIVFEMDYDGRYINIAPTSSELMFKPTEDVIGKTLHEVFPKPEADQFLGFIRQCLDENKTVTIEYPLILNDKTTWFEGKATPKTKNSVFYIARDITDHKRAEEALRESEELYRKLFGSSKDAIMTLEPPTWKFTSGNSAILEMFKVKDIDEFTSLGPWNVSPEEQPDGRSSSDKAKEMIQIAMDKGSNFFEWTHQRRDGELFSASVLLTRVDLLDKCFLQATVRDITDRKKAEEALQESEEKFRNFVETSADLVFRLTKTGRIEYISPRVEELYGYQPDELIGKHLRKTTPLGDVSRAIKALNMVYAGKPLKNFEINQKLKSGRIIPMEVNAVPVYKSGKIVGFQGIMRDITERKQAEEIQKTLFNISNAINTADSMQLLCLKVREYLGNVIDTTNFYVALYDEKTDMISLPFDVDEKDDYETFPAGKTLTKYVIKTGQSLLVDEHLFTKLIKEGEVEDIGTPSEIWLGVPLKIENKVIGVIVVQSYDDPHLYTEKDIEILTFISAEIALAIKHKQAEEQIKRNLKEKTTLLQELYHRTKNNMQVISSMLRMQSRRSDNEFIQTAFKEINNKIKAMSLVHQKLYQAEDLSNINLRGYVEGLLKLLRQSYSVQSEVISLKLDLKEVFVLIDSAIPLGLVLNELIVNVYKHAFPDSRKGEVNIRLYREENGTIHIHLADDGVGLPVDFDPARVETMGLQTVYSLVEYQLNGEINYKAEEGLKWHIKFKDDQHKKRV